MTAAERSVAHTSLPHSTTPQIDPSRTEKHLAIHEAEFRGADFRQTLIR